MNRKATRTLFLLTAIFALVAGPALANNLLFEFSDPRGDDHGDGSMLYPIRTDFERGDLDITSLKVRAVNGGTRFDATFARPIRVAEREAVDELGTTLDTVARHGFYTFNIDIYIDTDREPNSGGISMLPGRKAEIHPEHAWERAIVLTPRPHAARSSLERVVIKTLAEFNVRGERRTGRVGVWVTREDKPANIDGTPREDKIAAIGVRLRKWVSFHGLSINVEPDLEHFEGIVPCGIREHGVTSLVDLGLPVTMDDVDNALRRSFDTVFGGK